MAHLDELKNNANDIAANLQQDEKEVVKDLQERAHDAWDSAQDQTQRAVRQGTEYIRENSLPAVATAFLVGLALGWLWGRRDEESFDARYLAKPVQRSRDLLVSVPVALASAGAIFSRFGRSAAESVKNAVPH